MEQTQSNKARKRQQRRANKSKFTATPITPLNERQADLLDSLNHSTQVFAIGEAGTGKTWLSARTAMQHLKHNKIDKIYIARPTVSEKRHEQGFLPGKLEAKLQPWLVPLIEAFKDETTSAEVTQMMVDKRIEFLSFEHMRGRTFKNAYVLLDEAQNCTFSDLKMFLTRKGEGTTYVVTGDITQVDIPDSGLEPIIDMVEKYNIDADIIEFLPEDVVRSVHAREWVEAFDKVRAINN